MENDLNLGAKRWQFLCQHWNTVVAGVPFRDWLKTLNPDIGAAVDEAIIRLRQF